MVKQIAASALAAALAVPALALSHGASDEKKAGARPAAMHEETPFGRAGDPKRVTRTIEVGMDDRMHFYPGHITVAQGDVIRFVAKNDGKLMHEMVLGTMSELKEHYELMKKHPGMEHDEPYMAHVPPGKSQEIVWHFTKAGKFFYACLIPGHLEAGMIGNIVVAPKK